MKGLKQRHGATTRSGIHTAGISSVAKTQRSQYVELHALGRETCRLTKEMHVLETRRETIRRRLASIGRRILTLQQEMVRQGQVEKSIPTPRRPVRMVDINY
jgi:hypothetical protein